MSSVNFSAAQERVLTRRAAREAAELARIQHDASRARLPRISSLPFPLNRTSTSLHLVSTFLQGREGTRPAYRVGQVDAELLDEELLVLLQSQAGQALKYFRPHLADEWSQEILLALRAFLFKLSIWDHDASYGAVLQNLHYVDARSESLVAPPPSRFQKGLYGTLTILGRYSWEKWENWLIDHGSPDSPRSDIMKIAVRLTSWLSTAHSIAAFTSFLVFLINGRYRTIFDRLLQLRLSPRSSQVSRQVSFEYLNRQLVWHAFTEFLLFLLPLVGINRWRRWLNKLWRKVIVALRSGGGDPSGGVSTESCGPLAHLAEGTCAICYQDQTAQVSSEAELLGMNVGIQGPGIAGSASMDIVNPYQTIPCNCVYCFVCITLKLEAEEGEGWPCLRCGEVVKMCQPWYGDVLVANEGTQSFESSKLDFSDDDDHEGRASSAMAELEPRQEDGNQESLAASIMWSRAEFTSSET